MMRTTAPPIAISIVPESTAGRCEGADGRGGGAGAAITTGANTGAASLISGGCACGPSFRRGCGVASASRRQANNCCGLSPLRRATSETLAPRSRLSTTMRALSARDHRRRRPEPVISSIRRTSDTPAAAQSPLLSSLRSSVMSKGSLIRPHYAAAKAQAKCGVAIPLTLHRAGVVAAHDGDRLAVAFNKDVRSRIARVVMG
jgi:hypothetical protein